MHYWKRQKKKKKKITDVWITAFIGFMASTEQVFQVHIHQRPQWSLWVYKEKYSPIVIAEDTQSPPGLDTWQGPIKTP